MEWSKTTTNMGTRRACSRDIANRFARYEALQLLHSKNSSVRLVGHVYSYKIFMLSTYRCGESLTHFMSKPFVEHFFNGTPMKNILCDKNIYAPGQLRKVLSILYAPLPPITCLNPATPPCGSESGDKCTTSLIVLSANGTGHTQCWYCYSTASLDAT